LQLKHIDYHKRHKRKEYMDMLIPLWNLFGFVSYPINS